jgi:hypothetical protein
VAPTTGDRCVRAWPSLHAERFQLCVEAFAQAFPDRLHLLWLDNRGAPTSPRLLLPPHVRLVFLPPYGPALHPLERVWRDLKDDVAWPPFAAIEAQQDRLRPLLRADAADPLHSLTGDPDLGQAM